jgi:molybdate/tungstate transport system ATP-binding protein
MIRIDGLRFSIGNFSLQDVTLDVRHGEYFVLLGKPGTGKTMFLECVAGLKRVEAGTIEIDSRRVEKKEPRDRGIGYVPQDYALFSTRTVRNNIAFPLLIRHRSRAKRRARVEALSKMLGIEYLLDRGIHGLSGGEQQRVALARAVASRPKVLLLDEPVSALDAETRDNVLAELRRVHRETNTTTIHVCHDLDEMRSVADRVGVLQEGRLVQADTPEIVCRSPANPGVAKLFRLGAILPGKAVPEGSGCRVTVGELSLRSHQFLKGDVTVLIRAREVRLLSRSSQEEHISARIESILRLDSALRLDLRARSALFQAMCPYEKAEALSLKEGDTIRVALPSEAIQLFPGADAPA